MNIPHLQESPSGRLVQSRDGEQVYWAFVPHPLPPALEFDVTLRRALSEADRALGELVGLARTLSNPSLLSQPLIRREAVLSSRIEGTQTTVAGLYAFEAGQVDIAGLNEPRQRSDAREVLNYVEALQYGLERMQTLPISLRFLCEVHERLLAGVRGQELTPGEFRRRQNFIGNPGAPITESHFVSPPVPEMHACLDAFEKYLHSDDG